MLARLALVALFAAPAPAVPPPAPAATPDDLLASAAAALRSGDPWKAEEAARRFHERFPEDPRARLLLGAFLEERDPDRAAGLYKQAGGVPSLPGVEPQQAVTTAGAAWVAATAARVRLEAREEAPAVGVLPIGSRVEVVAISGKFARARCPAPLRLTGKVAGAKLVPGATTPPSADSAPLEAFVALELLDGKPPAEARYAKRAIEASDPARKLALLLRAHALAPEDVAVLLSVRDVAVQAQQWWYAIAAERLWLQLSAEKPAMTVEVRQLFGCRGDWRKALTVRPVGSLVDALLLPPDFEDDGGVALTAFPRDACLADFADAKVPCPYCQEYSCEAGLEEATPAEQDAFYSRRDNYYSEREREGAKAISANARFVGRVSRLFPSPPLVKVTVRNRTLTAQGAPRLFVYATKIAAGGGCNDGTLTLDVPPPVVAPVPISAIRAGGSAEAVFEVPRYAGTLYGVIEAADLAEATAKARGRVEEIAREVTAAVKTLQREAIELGPLEGWTYGELCCCYRV